MRTTVTVLCFGATLGWSQNPQTPASSLTGRSIQAIGYRVSGGSTKKVDFKNTGLIPQVAGDAQVDAKSRCYHGRR